MNIKEKIYDFAEVEKKIEELWNSEEVKKINEHIEDYLVTEEKCAKEDTDKDRCSFTWENLYIRYYKGRAFWNGTNFDEYKLDYNISYKDLTCRISGDVLFNFKSEEDGAAGKGKKTIECGKDVVKYMELAIKYWIMKDKILSQ